MSMDAGQAGPDRIFKRAVSPAWGFLAVFVLALIFTTDLITDLGFAHGALYVLPMLLAVMTGNTRWLLGVTAGAMVLTLLAPLFAPPPPDGVPMFLVVANRIASLVVIASTCVLSLGLLQWFRQSSERKTLMAEAVRDLDRNQRLLRVASEMAQLGGWEITLPDYQLHWSDQVRAIYELPPDHTPDLAEGINYYIPEDRDRVRAMVEACARDGTPFDEELRITTARGREIWVRAAGKAVRGPEGNIIALEGVLQDISGSKAMEASLALSHQRFMQLADSMPLIVWTAEPDGRVDFFSQTLLDYSGIGMGELARRNRWLRALHKDDRAGCLRAWKVSVTARIPFSVEARILRSDGAYRWHVIQASPSRDADGRVLKWYGSAMEIHDRVQLEHETLSLSQRLRDTLESMSDAFFLLDHDWKFAYMNNMAEQLLKRDREDLIGQAIWDAFPEARDSDFEAYYVRAVTEQRATHFQSYFTPLETWFEVNAYPSPRGLAVYFQNINERLNLEERLRESQRLESLGQLTGGVAHDFNNLLTVIIGNTDLLQEQLASQPRLQVLARISATAAQRGAELTQRLLAFARRQALAPRTVDVNRLVMDMRGMLERTLGEQYPLDCIRGPRLWQAEIDPGQLENALLNLCLNARDAMPSGGRLRIAIDNAMVDEADAQAQMDAQPGAYVVLSVSDSGQGIDPKHLHRVFEPFFTTKPKGKGTGLGLSMVYGFIRQSRGHVRIDSQPGQGTTVRLYLPRAVGKSETPSPTESAAAPTGGAESILLVEDDELVRHNAKAQLLSLGYQVMAAADGADALEVIRSNAPIDLLFTDVVMPGGMNGKELADAARETRPDLRVLFTSGYTREVINHDGQLDPGVLLLTKPYRRADLAKKIREAMGITHTDAGNEGDHDGQTPSDS